MSFMLLMLLIYAVAEHHYWVVAAFIGLVVWSINTPDLPKENTTETTTNTARTAVNSTPPKTSVFDRVKYVQVHFYDWRNHKEDSMKWTVKPERRNGHIEFWFDSRIMVDLMMEKQSVELYDSDDQYIPGNSYTYAWDEIKYPGTDGDGCAILKVFPYSPIGA